jgi:hypothetical protein
MEVTSEGKHVMTLPRYGVWVKDGDVIEVSDDLAYLQKKYNVPDSDVHKL